MNVEKELDVRGLSCPLPVLRTKQALNSLDGGKVLKVTATDPAAVKDIQALARHTGNELLESAESGGEYTFLLRRQ